MSPPHRISLEDLSPSVVLHMTEKLGYKNSDVINTVLSNRACHILAIYFLLNKKLERYLSGVSGTSRSSGAAASGVAKLPMFDPCCYFSLKRETWSFLRWCCWLEMCSKCCPIKVSPGHPQRA